MPTNDLLDRLAQMQVNGLIADQYRPKNSLMELFKNQNLINALARINIFRDIEERQPYASESQYFKSNPTVAGMASEDNRVVLNPFSNLSEKEKGSVAQNERARVFMRLMGAPDFYITPEQSSAFKNYGSENDVKSTISARIFSGDPSAGRATPEQRKWVNSNLGNGYGYGNRPNGTPKGMGWLGEIPTKDGRGVMTELSIGVNFDGKEVLIPAIVPTLTQAEIEHLSGGGELTKEIIQKAVDHARQRMGRGLSPFAD